MRVYSVQFKVSLEDWEGNLDTVRNLMDCVKENSLVLLPEMFSSGFNYENLEGACNFTKEALGFMKEVSDKKSLLVCGSLPVKENECIYNRAFLVQDGEVLGWKDKIKLFPLTDEGRYFKPGRENPVFESKFGKLGVLICFELRFSETAKQLRDRGADIILVPAQWGAKRREHLKVLSRARAIETQSYLILSDTWGRAGKEEYAGCSAIYSPWGEVLAFSESEDTLLTADIDTREVRKVRRYIPMD